MFDQLSKKIEILPLNKLKLLDSNPRRINKDQMLKLCNRLQKDHQFLMHRPILVNHKTDIETGKKFYQVYGGNQRVRAARKLGWGVIPCIVDEDLDENILKERVIVDNKSFGEFDEDILANEWDMELLFECGFEAHELGFYNEKEKPEKEESSLDDEKEEHEKCPNCGFDIV